MYRYWTKLFPAGVFATLVLMAAAAGAPALAQGMADDTACVLAGLFGEEFGLCNAYCEAMDCDGDTPQASAKACDKVRAKFEAIAFDPELPCLAVEPTNAKPVVDLNGTDPGIDTTATFVSFGDAVPIALDVAITDDGTVITSTTIELKNPVVGENESLALTPEGLILLEGLGGTWEFDSATGILLITGDGELADYEDIIQQVVYDNGDDSPDLNTARTIDVSVSDDAFDATAVGEPAVSVLLVEHGCPCSSFLTDTLVSPGLLDLFTVTEVRSDLPQIDWGVAGGYLFL